ncbi:DUF1223 domain-containing protein [Devosia rhodophyticola]|uniref:DUF1223 domain-containing protein n=1 Tax=Devosia rhodophyticola TaxID=3026423 RepID=A0ABY7YU98_9HYPH|nr:DUF1223 domain-containing protein [Devosia rhodophyticola]WDR04425.1 DUF1223 domain-containing protein [Devosia rhodophyticola]
MRTTSLLAFSLSLAATMLLAAPALAEKNRLQAKAVVELFTSQGCSSCPPADKLLTRLSADDDVIALAYHVDYWDYIGWPDTFGSPENSEYQRAYAKNWESSRIYTPQMVINGTTGVVGSRQNDVTGALSDAALAVPIDLRMGNDMLKVSIAGKAGAGKATVWLVSYATRSSVVIERGENAGKTMIYSNVVKGRHMLGMWEPETGAELKLPLGELLQSPNSGIAILVQQEHGNLPGPIIGAAAIEN